MGIISSVDDVKQKTKKLFLKYYILISCVIILLGFIISDKASYIGGILGDIIHDFGIFLSATIAVTIIYNFFAKEQHHVIFLNDLKSELDNKLNNYIFIAKYPHVYESGRLSLDKKVEFLSYAKKEYIEIGVQLNTLISNFNNRAPSDFKEHVEHLLYNGVNFSFYLLDPTSEFLEIYSKDRKEPNLKDKIQSSINELLLLKSEFNKKGYKGSFNIYVYSNLPYCSIQLIDQGDNNGRALISNYLYGIKRAESPVIEIVKCLNPKIWDTYYNSTKNIMSNSRQVNNS